MRTKSDNGVISVKAISGTRVVILGLDINKGYDLSQSMAQMTLDNRKKTTKVKKNSSMFIGFSINRTDVETGETVSLNVDGKPIQKFLWGDYSVEPGKVYEVVREMISPRHVLSISHVMLHHLHIIVHYSSAY